MEQWPIAASATGSEDLGRSSSGGKMPWRGPVLGYEGSIWETSFRSKAATAEGRAVGCSMQAGSRAVLEGR